MSGDDELRQALARLRRDIADLIARAEDADDEDAWRQAGLLAGELAAAGQRRREAPRPHRPPLA